MKKALASRRFFPDVFGPGMSFGKISDGWWRWWKGSFRRRVGYDPFFAFGVIWWERLVFFCKVIFTFDDRFYCLMTLKSCRKSHNKNWEPWVPDKHVVKRRGKLQHLEWFGNSQLVQDFRHEQSGNKKKARGVYIHQDYWQLLVIIVLLFSACAFQSHLCQYVPDALPPLKLYIAPQNWWLEGNPFVVCSG